MIGERDYYFDNVKVFLILCVVVGHFLAPLAKVSHVIDALVFMIYLFHMPAFVFISGYFSKHNELIKLIKNLAVPYLIFQVFYSILIPIIKGEGFTRKLLYPKFALWFLVSLFLWRVLIEKLIKIKGILLLSILASILVGFDTGIGSLLSLSRTIVFLPFFILGYQFQKDKFMKYAGSRLVKITSASLIIVFGIASFTLCNYLSLSYLVYKANYSVLKYMYLSSFIRMGTLSAAVILTFAFMVLIPRKKFWFTYIGRRTMSIYLLHSLVYVILRDGTNLYEMIHDIKGYVMIFIFAIVLVFLLSNKIFDSFIKKLMNIPVEKLLRNNKV